jgi:hypothetical protein
LAPLVAAIWHLSLPLGSQRLHLDDAFYHLAEIRSWATEGLLGGVTTLPRTVLGASGPDHHFLFHVLLSPLLLLDVETALRLGSGLLGAGGSLAVWIWLRRSAVPYPGLWLLLLVGASEVYGFRLGLLRAQSLDIPLVLAGLWQVVHGRHKSALLLGFVFAWSHHGATLYGPVALLALLGQRLAGQPLQWRAALYLMGGVGLGFVVSPWFPQTLEYLFFHTFWKTRNPLGLDVGAEWLPATLGWMAYEAWPLHLVLVAAAARWASLTPRPKLQADTWALAGLTVLLGLLTLKHGRFADHWVALELACTALLVRDVWAGNPVSAPDRAPVPAPAPVRAPVLAAAAALLLLAGLRWQAVRGYMDDGWRPGQYASAGQWLTQHAKPGELVVNLRWEDYAFLTWFAPHQQFLIGLDPNYLAYADPKSYLLWDKLATPAMPADLQTPLTQNLHATLFVGPANTAMDQHPQLERVFAAPEATIWRLRP